ncbi:hypothetical protein Gpo141_00011063 [Globisporangium polare]
MRSLWRSSPRCLLSRSQRLNHPGCALSTTSSAASGDQPPAATGASWPQAVTPEMTRELLHRGYTVVRNAFPAPYLQAIKREMEQLRASGHFYANATHILLKGEAQPTLLHKRHIVETELALERIRSEAPVLKRFFEDEVVLAPLEQALPQWLSLSGAMVKLQYNEGNGGCFPLHFDTYGDDGKCVTAVLYLNEHWQEGDGGEIVLYPFPSEQPVVVAPRFGDMVLFSSQQMLHRVLPSRQPRFCLTTWIYQSPSDMAARAAYYRASKLPHSASNAQKGHASDADTDSAAFTVMMEKVLASPFRRHLIKLFYADEWTQSLHESHLPTDAFSRYMRTHEQELRVIESATEQMLGNFRTKADTQPSQLPATCAQLVEKLREDSGIEWRTKLQPQWF